jgi:hypothetical protein
MRIQVVPGPVDQRRGGWNAGMHLLVYSDRCHRVFPNAARQGPIVRFAQLADKGDRYGRQQQDHDPRQEVVSYRCLRMAGAQDDDARQRRGQPALP